MIFDPLFDTIASDAAAAKLAVSTQFSQDQSTIADLQGQVSSQAATISQLQAQIAADQAEEAAENAAKPLLHLANLHLRTDWQKRVGANIGGKVPTLYTWKQVPNPVPPANTAPNPVLELDIAGGAFSDWLAFLSTACTIPQGKLKCVLKFSILCDQNTPKAVQAIETDSKIIAKSPDGSVNMYDLSFQDFYAEGGMLQLWKAGGGWFDSGIVIPPFTPMQWRSVEIEYSLDTVGKQYQYSAYTLDGVRHDLSSSPIRTAQPTSWGGGWDIQLQDDINGSGLGYTLWFDAVDLFVYAAS